MFFKILLTIDKTLKINEVNYYCLFGYSIDEYKIKAIIINKCLRICFSGPHISKAPMTPLQSRFSQR